MSDLEKKFLLRSAGQITGPFNKKEVMSQIRRGVISVDDEVTEPFSIWWYLQDHPDFKDGVRSMSFQTRLINFVTSVSGKLSQASGTKSSSRTITDTETLESTQSTVSEVSKTPSIKFNSHEKKLAKEVQVQAVNATKPQQVISRRNYIARQKHEEMLKEKLKTWMKISWRIVILFALSIGAYIFYKEIFTPMKQKQSIMGELKREGFKFYKAGQYDKALFYFEKAYSHNILQDKEKLLLASLFLKKRKWQRSTLILDELSGRSVTQTANWFLLKGLISFAQKDFSTAESHFNKALKQDAKLALMNLVILKWKTEDYKQSLLYLDQLQKIPYERDIVFYLRALNFLSQKQNSDLINYINKELLLGQKNALVKEYKQELYLMLAYSYMKEEKTKELMKAVQRLLNEDPFFYKNYRYSSFISRESLNWMDLFPYCERVFHSNSKDSLLNALYGFCYLKAGQMQKGSQFIEQAKNREPENPFFLSMYAYLLMQKGEDLQLEQVLDAINYDSLTLPLPFIVKARFFEQRKDWVRALKTWRSLLNFSSYHISGISGVAITNYNLEDHVKAAIYRDRGLEIYPYHTQLLLYRNN